MSARVTRAVSSGVLPIKRNIVSACDEQLAFSSPRCPFPVGEDQTPQGL